MNPEEFYKNEKHELQQKLQVVIHKEKQYAFIRVFLFLSIIATGYAIFNTQTLLLFILIIFSIGLFIFTLKIHEKIKQKRLFIEQLILIVENEEKHLRYAFDGYESGGEFFERDHDYSADLVVFGKNSLYQYLNRAVTEKGKILLAEWLKKPAAKEVIVNRQKSVIELSKKPQFRHSLLAGGLRAEKDVRKTPEKVVDDLNLSFLDISFIRILIQILPIITTTLIGLSFFIIPYTVPAFTALLNLGFYFIFAKKVAAVYETTDRSHNVLKIYSNIFQIIEQASWESKKLKKLQKQVFGSTVSASEQISRLSKFLEILDIRNNGMVHLPLNALFLFDLQICLRLRDWKQQVEEEVPIWFNVLGEIEALSSFGFLHFNHPTWCFPKIHDKPGNCNAQRLAHPLLPKQERVANNLTTDSVIHIITGPNMSGKSTWLRTVGLNMVLAFAGGPVCAEKAAFSIVRIITSMQVHDDLTDNISFFYAELRRLKTVIDALTDEAPLFFIIDEMLKGTNALDRQKGSIALVKHLAKAKVPGLVGTHDMALAELEKEFPEFLINKHFDGYIEEEQLLFDYILQDGYCTSFNSLVLMKNIGIPV